MKNRKNIAPVRSLLLWVVWLCLSGYIRAEEVPLESQKYNQNEPAPELTAEGHRNPVALTEPSLPCLIIGHSDTEQPGLPPVGRLLFHKLLHVTSETFRATPGFPFLSTKFRILPNAP